MIWGKENYPLQRLRFSFYLGESLFSSSLRKKILCVLSQYNREKDSPGSFWLEKT
jgi:hypothetical protein